MRHSHIISTKLRIPAPRKQAIVRRHLHDKLDQLQDGKAAVVHGAPGSGKTTLLTTYIQARPSCSFRWISLDSVHNDLFTFWYYVFESVKGDLGEDHSLSELIQALPQRMELENLLIILINQLENAGRLVFVWDDFHVITDEQLLKTINFFVKNSSDSMQFILLSREIPKMYFGDLMMAGQYVEIGEDELRLTADESHLFLRNMFETEMERAAADRLYELTEGWVGGLQLMALASGKAPYSEITQMKTLNPYLIHYLSNEILSSVDQTVRQFLLQTSILQYFDEKICEAVTGITVVNPIIADLLHKNLFLVTIDEEQGVYRYHHLFGDFLRIKFADWPAEDRQELHQRAAQAYEEANDAEAAIHHLVQAENYERALQMIASTGPSVTGWAYLRNIPLEYLGSHREMAFQRLFYHLCNMEFEAFKQTISGIVKHDSHDTLGVLSRFSQYLIDEGGFELETDLSWLTDLERMDWNDLTKAIIYITSAFLFSFRDQFTELTVCIQQAERLEARLQNPYLRYFILSLKSQVSEYLGNYTECETIYEQMFQLIEANRYLSPLRLNGLIGLAGIYLRTLRLEQASDVLQQAKELLKPQLHALERGYLQNILELHVLRGDQAAARKIIAELESFPAIQNPLYESSIIEYRLWLESPDPELLRAYEEKLEQHSAARMMRMDDKIIYSRVLFLLGKSEQALEFVDHVLKKARKHKIKPMLVEALLLKARLLETTSSQSKRDLINLIREAVYYGARQEIVAIFHMEEEISRHYLPLLLEERRNDLSTNEIAFVHRLLKLWQPQTASEGLSAREIEVLKVMATGKTNKEIGEELHISLATVKSHMLHIYSKLYVKNRVEAIEKARKLGILD